MSSEPITQLDDRGDIDAPQGSLEWSRAIRWELQGAVNDERFNARQMKRYLQVLEQTHGYQHLRDEHGTPFSSIETFCVTPMPYGLGYEKSTIDAIIEERRSTQAKANAVAQKNMLTFPGRPSESDDKGSVTTFIDDDRGADYLLARVRRDAPDVFERVQRGEISSARAAAKEAGFLKERWSVPAHDIPAMARYLARKMDRNDIGELIANLEHLAREGGG